MNRLFCALTTGKIAALARRAEHRVILCIPAVRPDVAAAFAETAGRLGPAGVRVVLDCDEEVFRLGYGDVAAVRALQEARVDVRHSPGLRVGLLVVDDRAWAFTPTALYVQPETHSDETPNAVELRGQDVGLLTAAIWPEASTAPASTPTGGGPEPEIGQATLAADTVQRVEEALKIAPPIPFDIARQVRVFQPYIQYVEISLHGCSIQRHRVTIPKAIQSIGAAKDIENRLRTTFELIESNSALSSKDLDDELKALRDSFTRALGKPWGRVLLRSVRPLFDARIAEFRAKLIKHKKKVQEDLGKKLAESREQVVGYYLPLVKAKPPDSLAGQVLLPVPTEEVIRAWLGDELDRAFPSSQQLLSGMTLDVQFRDVTYETLNEPGFAEALKEAYPHVNWDKPFDEFNAAKEREERRDNHEGDIHGED